MAKNITESLPDGMKARPFMNPRKVESAAGNLYTFTYNSKTAKIGQPLIINVRRNNKRLFRAKNRDQYMAGIVLNNLSPAMTAFLIKRLGTRKLITWRDIKALGILAPKAYYRIYNVKYRRDFHVVDPSIYLERELEESR
jgi:hypothetical protein